MPLTKVDRSQEVHEYACHEGNLAMRNILSAARAADGVSAAAPASKTPYDRKGRALEISVQPTIRSFDLAHLAHLELLTPKPDESLRFLRQRHGHDRERPRAATRSTCAAGTTTSTTR